MDVKLLFGKDYGNTPRFAGWENKANLFRISYVVYRISCFEQTKPISLDSCSLGPARDRFHRNDRQTHVFSVFSVTSVAKIAKNRCFRVGYCNLGMDRLNSAVYANVEN